MLEVGVEREVVGGQRHVVVEEQLQAALGGRVEAARRAVPEQAVVDEDEVGALGGGALEQLDAGADAGHDRGNGLRTGDLEPVGAVVVEATGLQQRVEIAR